MSQQTSISLCTSPRSMSEITARIAGLVSASGIATGLAHVFVRHTSCSLLITENADPDVQRDLETLAARWAPDGDPAYRHAMEGDDDMAAHARSVLSGCELTVPIGNGRLLLGTWQGIYLWEHRKHAMQRELIVTIMD